MSTQDLPHSIQNWIWSVLEILWVSLSDSIFHDAYSSTPEGEPKTLLNFMFIFPGFFCIDMYVSSLKLQWYFWLLYKWNCNIYILLWLPSFTRHHITEVIKVYECGVISLHSILLKNTIVSPFSWLIHICLVSSVLLLEPCFSLHSYVCFLVSIWHSLWATFLEGKCWEFRTFTTSTLLMPVFQRCCKTLYILQQ